ncbi:cell wall protein RBR3, partial [Biomphalaria glabrata]
ASLLQDGSSSHMSDTTAEVSKINDGMENFSEDSNTQDSLNSIGATSPVVKRGRGRGGYRGRWAHWKQNAQLRRKSKLKELIKQCKDEELMEVVLPRLVNSVSVWEFLMMKSEKGGSRPQVDVIYREFESLRQHVQKACADYMKPLSPEELVDDNLQCKMIKVSDKNLATCLGLDTLTYRVREMPPGDSNSFSSLHNKLSAAALTVVSNTKPTSDQPDAKRSGSEVPLEQGQNQVKKPKISTYVSWDRLSQPANVNASVVTSQQGSSLEEKTIISRSDSSLSSVSSLSSSSVTSPQLNFSTAVTSSTVTTSSSPPTFTSSVSKPVSVSSVTVRSPFVHIACPTTVSYVLADSKGQHLLGANKGASKGQSVPVLITPQLTTGQILPTISSVQPKILVATPQSQQASIAATTASQQPNATTLLLATAAPPSAQHRVVVRQPPQQTKILVPSQSTVGKPQGMSTISLFSTTASPSVSHSRSILSQAKPAEVKVSRQLFHDTTSSTISTSVALSNGRSSNKTASLLSTSQTVFQPHLPARTTTVPAISPIVSSNTTEATKPKPVLSTRTLVTPPSGQQFIASPNKATGVQVIVSESEMDDIEVLNSLGFTDDLSTLAVSADNLNGTLSTTDLVSVSSVTEADSFLHPQATDSNCKYVTTGEASVTSSPSFGMIQNGTISVLDGMAYINGSSTDFSTNSSPPISIKDSSNVSAGTLVVSSATSTGDFIISKSQMGFSSTMLHSSPYTNGGSQDIKTESLNNSSMILADMSGLQYEQADASVHLNGRSLLQSVETPEDSINLLSDNLPVSEPPDADAHFLDTRDSGMPSGDEVDNQIYLSEGTNIYQTEDGTIIIQSADGNTYQLQGAQGLSLETVQALLSGQLNQLTEDTGSGGVQML